MDPNLCLVLRIPGLIVTGLSLFFLRLGPLTLSSYSTYISPPSSNVNHDNHWLVFWRLKIHSNRPTRGIRVRTLPESTDCSHSRQVQKGKSLVLGEEIKDVVQVQSCQSFLRRTWSKSQIDGKDVERLVKMWGSLWGWAERKCDRWDTYGIRT